MLRQFAKSIFILFISNIAFAQNVVKVSGEAQVELTKDKSRLEIEQSARDMATIDALERAFGRVVIQGNSTYLTNLNTGQKSETKSIFNMIANTSVNGKVLQVLEEKYTDVKGYKYIDGKKTEITDIKCEITIKAMEMINPEIEFTAFPLRCLNIDCRKTNFLDNDDFYFYFSSPISGYLSIFLDDQKNTYRLLPYKEMPAKYESGIPVKADKEYFLFSDRPEYDYFKEDKKYVDTYQLYAETMEDMNRLFIIFSKSPLNKPKLKKEDDQFVLSEKEIEAGYMVPKSLESEDFQRWLNKNRSYRKDDMQVEIIDITITKK